MSTSKGGGGRIINPREMFAANSEYNRLNQYTPFGSVEYSGPNNNIVTHETWIVATAPNNLIASNIFRYCTKAMNTVAGNRVGTLLIGTSSGAINGNSGGGLGTSDPNANIIY